MLKKTATFFLVFLAFALVSWSVAPGGSRNSFPSNGRGESYEDDDDADLYKSLETAIKKSKVASAIQQPASSSSPYSSSSSSPSKTGLFSTNALRYEYDQENAQNSDLEKLRESCDVRDLERAAYFDLKSKSDNVSKNGWLFRNWCGKYSKLASPFVEGGEQKESSSTINSNSKNNKNKKRKDKTEYETSFDSLPFRLDSDQLRALFQDQVTLFVGDSVVRNHFVLMMARMCNEKRRGKCMTRLPTYEYDIVRPNPAIRGPLGCIPEGEEDDNNNNVSNDNSRKNVINTQDRNAVAQGRGSSKRGKSGGGKSSAASGESNNNNNDDSDNNNNNNRPSPSTLSPSSTDNTNSDVKDVAAAADEARKKSDQKTLTDCYKKGDFRFVAAPGLTASREPRRTERKQFHKKGIITPMIRMEVDGAVFYYVPVNTPKQIVKFGKWLAMKAGRSGPGLEMLKARTVFVSTGPHLSQREMNSSILLLKPALSFIQSVLRSDSSIILAETTHLLNGPAWYADFVDGVMDRWREELADLTPPNTNNNNNNNNNNNEGSGSGGGNNENKSTIINQQQQIPTVELVPQRFVTVGGYFGQNTFVRETGGQETMRKQRRTCEYYDSQHPAASCHETLTELMLLAAYTSRARKLRNQQK